MVAQRHPDSGCHEIVISEEDRLARTWLNLLQTVTETGEHQLVASTDDRPEVLYVNPGPEFPELGVMRFSQDGGVDGVIFRVKGKYVCRPFYGYPLEYGEVIVVNPTWDEGITSLPVEYSEDVVTETVQRYEIPLFRALATFLGQPVLHSFTVSYFETEHRSYYMKLGYLSRRGYPELMEHIYYPEEALLVVPN